MIGVGFLLQAGALRFGQLSSVQPIVTTELLFLVLILGVWFRYHLTWREWGGSAAAAGGLATFLVVAGPGGGDVVPTRHAWIVVFVVIGAASAGCAALGFTGPRWFRAAMFGGVRCRALRPVGRPHQAVHDAAVDRLGPRAFTDWVPYALVATGRDRLFLIQSSFHAGPVTASQASPHHRRPVVSVVIGIYLFHDRLQTAGWRLPVEVVAIVVVVAGRVPAVDVAAGGRGEGRVGGGRQAGAPAPAGRRPSPSRRCRSLDAVRPPAPLRASTDRTASSRSAWAEREARRRSAGRARARWLASTMSVAISRAEGHLEGGGGHGQDGGPVEGRARGPGPARRRWPASGAVALTGPDSASSSRQWRIGGHLVVQGDPAPVLAARADPAAESQPEQGELLGQRPAGGAEHDARAQVDGPDAGRPRPGRWLPPTRRTRRPGSPWPAGSDSSGRRRPGRRTSRRPTRSPGRAGRGSRAATVPWPAGRCPSGPALEDHPLAGRGSTACRRRRRRPGGPRRRPARWPPARRGRRVPASGSQATSVDAGGRAAPDGADDRAPAG